MSKRRDVLRARIEAEERAKQDLTVDSDKKLAKWFVEQVTKDYPRQLETIMDPSLHIALFGSRRSSKTTVMGAKSVKKALEQPYSQILYIGLTQDSCQKVMYDAVLSRFKRMYDLPAKLIGNDQMVFDNGSIIYLIGLDANKTQKEKIRGIKASMILIDEMQSYRQDIKVVIDEILGPTAADTKSAMIISGTAGNATIKSYWYEITYQNTKDKPEAQSELHPEWKLSRWEWENNTAIDDISQNKICDNVKSWIDDKEKAHPGTILTDSHRQEWDLEWIVSTDTLIYRYTDANLLLSPTCVEIGTDKRIEMPGALFLSTAKYILGLDLGYNDPTAMVVCAYNIKYSNKLYVIETFDKSEMLVPEIASKIRNLDNLYHFERMVGDSSSLQVFETLKQTYGLSIEKANRSGKLSHQLVLNSDLQTRSIVFLPGNERLTQQLQTVQWDRSAMANGRYVEDPKCLNDISDAFLYAHNYSRHHWYTAPKPQDSIMDPMGFNRQLASQLIKKNRPKAGLFNGSVNFAEPNRTPSDSWNKRYKN